MAKEVLFWLGMKIANQDMCATSGIAIAKLIALLSLGNNWSRFVCIWTTKLPGHRALFLRLRRSTWINGYAFNSHCNKTKVDFARFGNSRTCYADNGPKIVAKAYKRFVKEYDFLYTTSSPYHTQGDSRAEAAVKPVQNIIKKTDVFQAVPLNQRNTPQRGHSYSPAQRMLCRRTRTKLPTTNKVFVPKMINRATIQEDSERKRNTSKIYCDKTARLQH